MFTQVIPEVFHASDDSHLYLFVKKALRSHNMIERWNETIQTSQLKFYVLFIFSLPSISLSSNDEETKKNAVMFSLVFCLLFFIYLCFQCDVSTDILHKIIQTIEKIVRWQPVKKYAFIVQRLSLELFVTNKIKMRIVQSFVSFSG